MKQCVCPRCGASLIESEYEMVQETGDGGILLEVHPVYKCTSHNCEYMKRYEPIPEIIAQQEDDRLLLLYPNEVGRILDIRDNVIWPENHYQSILARGYWDSYSGNHDVSMLLEHARDSEAAYLEVPNLFEFATSELSQDAFLCWFMSWSQEIHRSIDKSIHDAAVDFVSMIFNAHQYPAPTIKKIEIKRQFQALDVLAIVNDTYAILIEDKTFTKNHSDQLNRYRETVAGAYPNLIQLPVYYKIADQSHYQTVIDSGYFPFLRKRMLEVLQRGKENGVNHPIYLDYFSYLTKLDCKVYSYCSVPVMEWDSFAWQGFYMELQKHFQGNWGYVTNPSGGFWGFWWKPESDKPYYVQLQQEVMCVKVKVDDKKDVKDFRKKELGKILLESEQRGLYLKKTKRMGTGKTITLAQREDYIQTNEEGKVDLEKTFAELKKWECTAN